MFISDDLLTPVYLFIRCYYHIRAGNSLKGSQTHDFKDLNSIFDHRRYDQCFLVSNNLGYLIEILQLETVTQLPGNFTVYQPTPFLPYIYL